LDRARTGDLVKRAEASFYPSVAKTLRPTRAPSPWRRIGDFQSTHVGSAIALLLDARVLLAGGVASSGAGKPTIEFAFPGRRNLAQVGDLLETRCRLTATRLLNGCVLFVGSKGALLQGFPLTAATEIFTP